MTLRSPHDPETAGRPTASGVDVVGKIAAVLTRTRRSLRVGKRCKTALKTLPARYLRRRSRATFIAITGSSAKTTTASLLAHILSADFKVRLQAGRNTFHDTTRTLRHLAGDEQFVVLELGTDGPGQLERMTRLVKPHISIVTLTALEHYTAFRSLEAVAAEKAAIVRGLPSSGLAILNADDANVRNMASATPARSVLFGTTAGEYQATISPTGSEEALALTIRHGDQSVVLHSRLVGVHHWLAVTAAATCALQIGVSPRTVAARVASFAPINGRMSIHRVPRGPVFLLDTAKAPYHSILLPLETLRALQAPRKRFVLGQIADYRGNSDAKYRAVYRAAREVADEVIFVGDAAHKARAPREDITQGRFRAFERVADASAYLSETALRDEVILVKSARNLHLERLMVDQVEAVRCWPNECGSKLSCFECGRFRSSFSEHCGKAGRRFAQSIRKANSPAA